MAVTPPVTGTGHDMRRSYVLVMVVWLLQIVGLYALHVYFS